MRERIYINNDWKFSKRFNSEMLELDYDFSKLENVRLPHSVVETPYNYFDEGIYQMISAYQKKIYAKDSWNGKKITLTIEAAAHRSEVYLNGELLASHSCGYTAYNVDLSDKLIYGKENNLLIKVDSNETLNQPPFGNVIDYMTYGGIYREVYLEITNKAHIKDVFPKVSILDNGDVLLESEVKISIDKKLSLRQELYDNNKNIVAIFSEDVLRHQLSNVKLWDIDNPNLYYLKTILYNKDIILDERFDRIGFRTVEFKKDGFYLNNKKIKIRGLNRHQSYPYVGYAMPKSMQVNDAVILKRKLGLNAVRTSHYPQSHHFINTCDELGLLVFMEIPGWQHIGNSDWKNIAVQNTKDMILEFRNHPSIFIWGVRINESADNDEFYERTNAIAHQYDSTRQTTGVRCFLKSSLLEDVYSYNDFSHDGTNPGTRKKHIVTPNMDKGYLITEYGGHMFPTKTFDIEDHRLEHMMRHAKVMNGYYGDVEIAGGFGWCMTDYNTHKDFGSGDRICYHGVLDMYRNPKFVAGLYASQQEDEVILEVSSTMDIGEHPACLIKDIYAVTNADFVNLYKDNKFVACFKPDNSPYPNILHAPILVDDIIGNLMEEGEGFSHKKSEEIKKIVLSVNKFGMKNIPFSIKLLILKCMLFRGLKISDIYRLQGKYITDWGGTVTTYKFEAIKNGEVVKTIIRKPVKKVEFDINVSHTDLVEDTTYDVAAIQIKATDDNGSILHFYQESLRLEIEGPIEIIGPNFLTLRGGMGGTYIKSIGEFGNAKLKIYNESILIKEIEFKIA